MEENDSVTEPREDPFSAEDKYERLHGGYRELRSKIQDVDNRVSGVLSAVALLKWIGGALVGGTVAIGWNTCTRAVDNEKQITVNTGRMTAMESRMTLLEANGTTSSRLALQQITDMQGRFTAFVNRYDAHVQLDDDHNAKQNDMIAEMKGKIANHENNWKKMNDDLERIDRLQQERDPSPSNRQ